MKRYLEEVEEKKKGVRGLGKITRIKGKSFAGNGRKNGSFEFTGGKERRTLVKFEEERVRG